MDGYRNITDAPAVEDFPKINAKKLEQQINKLFKPYLFYHDEKGKRRFECSYCGEKFTREWIQRTMTQNDQWLIDCGHNDIATCPCCGTTATTKNVSRLGKRKKLEEYIPVCIVSEKRGELYVRAYWARKDYRGELTEMPLFYCVELYHFKPNRADMYVSYYGQFTPWGTVTDNYDPNHRKITEPFTKGSYMPAYVPYYVVGWEAIEKSKFFRYCQYDKFSGRSHTSQHYSLMKYLAAYSIYPRNIEMLMKSGFRAYVDELVDGRRKNARAIKWGETDPRKAFGLSGQELKEYIARGNDKPELLVIYKRLRRAGMPVSFETAEIITDLMSDKSEKFLKLCVKYAIPPEKLIRYLRKQMDKYDFIQIVFGMLVDYVDMAEKLGWDLTDESVLLPKSLVTRHDEATAETQAKAEMIANAEKEERRRQAEETLERRRQRYNFSLDGYFIRIAETEDEILREGKVLHHCVGGYAQRHMTNKTTILFLRAETAPNLPLVTIEMNGEKLVQIHGYRNDAQSKMPPRKEYGFIVEPWLRWIKAGSKRDKDGNPKIRKNKEKAA